MLRGKREWKMLGITMTILITMIITVIVVVMKLIIIMMMMDLSYR